MNAEASMLAGTLEADPDAVGAGDPLRIESSTLKARLNIFFKDKPTAKWRRAGATPKTGLFVNLD